MKNSNDQKGYQSPEKQYNKEKEDNPEIYQMTTGFGTQEYEKNYGSLKDTEALGDLKDNFRLNTTGTDDDLAIDIQDAIERDTSLFFVADNILVTVEGEIVTLEGEVYREEEKMAAGDVATTFAGEDNVNNYLRIINSSN